MIEMEEAMKRRVKKHLLYYVSFVLIQVVGAYIVYLFSFNFQLQITTVILMSFFYFLFAILHQYLHHTLHPKIVIEYALMGTVGIAVTFFLIHSPIH